MSRICRGHGWEIRLGRWEDALSSVKAGAIITDPPYSDRTHQGQFAAPGVDGIDRRPIDYSAWGESEALVFASSWASRVSGWSVVLSDHRLAVHHEYAWLSQGRTVFAPVACVISGMTVRLCGDGPSSWVVYANVSRPRALSKWGTLPGAYVGPRENQVRIGGKPLWLMRSLVCDYTKPGDLIVDPCAGGGTTLVAAIREGRKAIGAEADPEAFDAAVERLMAEDRHLSIQAARAGQMSIYDALE